MFWRKKKLDWYDAQCIAKLETIIADMSLEIAKLEALPQTPVVVAEVRYAQAARQQVQTQLQYYLP